MTDSYPFKADIIKASSIVRQLATQLVRNGAGYSHGWIGRGLDPSSSDHGTGRALDYIISERVGRMPTSSEKAFGDMVADWLISIAEPGGIRHIIWYGRIWKRRYRHTPTAWSKLSGRKGVSDWHYDHIHVFFDHSNGYVPDISFTLEKDMEMADAKEIIQAFMEYPITANGKKAEFAQHFAELLVDTRAQSVAVSAERVRDRENIERLSREIKNLKTLIEGLL